MAWHARREWKNGRANQSIKVIKISSVGKNIEARQLVSLQLSAICTGEYFTKKHILCQFLPMADFLRRGGGPKLWKIFTSGNLLTNHININLVAFKVYPPTESVNKYLHFALPFCCAQCDQQLPRACVRASE